jgi:asparagine N-glycosylation enzyme membrane subunit Stt3
MFILESVKLEECVQGQGQPGVVPLNNQNKIQIYFLYKSKIMVGYSQCYKEGNQFTAIIEAGYLLPFYSCFSSISSYVHFSKF